MQVTKASPARVARRRQVVDALIAVVAEEGYDAATFSRLANRAGLSSTRLISYHFDDKDELVAAATAEIYRRIAAALDTPRDVEGGGTGTAALEAYLRAAIGLSASLAPEMRTLATLFLRHRPTAAPLYDRPQENDALTRVRGILEAGQEDGSMRADFDPAVVAGAVQRAVDGIPLALSLDPGLDLDHLADELVDLFRHAVSRA